MKRPLSLVAASFAALSLLALPAAAESAHVVRGSISSVRSGAISVRGASGVVTTCTVAKRSPDLTGYSTGSRVQMICVRLGAHRKLVLFKIRHLPAEAAPAASDDAATTFAGAITALTDDSISLHDGDRDLSCELDASSPATGDFRVGQHVKITCAGGSLVAIAPVATAEVGRYFTGAVAQLGATAITLTTDRGPVICTIADGSPSVAALHVGDRIGMGCKASTMQLVLIRQVDGGTASDPTSPPPPPPATHVLTGAGGTLSALTDGSLTVKTDRGEVTCTIDSSSPGVSSFAVGDRVKMACWDGVLHEIAKVS